MLHATMRALARLLAKKASFVEGEGEGEEERGVDGTKELENMCEACLNAKLPD